MVHHNFRMHWARVFLPVLLPLLMLVIVLAVRAIGVNGTYLCARYERHQRKRSRD